MSIDIPCADLSWSHSEATQAQVKLKKSRHGLHLSISDDGQGFDTGDNSMGNGLKNMEKRVKEINGDLAIDSAKDKGTIVLFFNLYSSLNLPSMVLFR